MKKIVLFAALIYSSLMFSVAQAQETYWDSKKVQVQLTGEKTQLATYSGVFNRILVTHNYYECGYYQEPEVETRPGTCYELKCSGGSGQSPQWDAFYSAKKAEKASMLAKAIRGVGKTSAEALVAGNYFSKKPRSWEAFKQEISRAASQGVITNQVKTLVLNTYRNDNMRTLGYAPGACVEVAYPCDEVIIIREGGYVPQTCDDKQEQVIDQKMMNYDFQITGTELLPGEKETLNFNISGKPTATTLDNTYYNSYRLNVQQVSNNDVSVRLQATQRNRVEFPAKLLESAAVSAVNSKSIQVRLGVGADALAQSASEKLVVVYTVKSCQIGMFGICGIGWDKRESYFANVNSLATVQPLPLTLDVGRRGLKVEVDVKLHKENSVHHQANEVMKTTNLIVIK